jgi:hypothetical protein
MVPGTSWESSCRSVTQEFPDILWNPRFISMFKRARHLSLSWIRLIESITPHPISLKSILILSTHRRLGLPGGHFPSGFYTKSLWAFLTPNVCSVPSLSHPPWQTERNLCSNIYRFPWERNVGSASTYQLGYSTFVYFFWNALFSVLFSMFTCRFCSCHIATCFPGNNKFYTLYREASRILSTTEYSLCLNKELHRSNEPFTPSEKSCIRTLFCNTALRIRGKCTDNIHVLTILS